jgi:hypothetical protein
MTDFSCETIDIDLLEAIHGGAKPAAATTTTPATPVTPQKVGNAAISGCLTGIGSSLGKSPQAVGLGCLLGAGKSIFTSLGSAFGGGAKK